MVKNIPRVSERRTHQTGDWQTVYAEGEGVGAGRVEEGLYQEDKTWESRCTGFFEHDGASDAPEGRQCRNYE